MNNTSQTLVKFWLTCEGSETSYGRVRPNSVNSQDTYTTHVWRLRDGKTEELIAEHVGGNSTLLAEPTGITVLSGILDITPNVNVRKEWGAYRTRFITPAGVCIKAWDCVPEEAIVAADRTLGHMFLHMPPDLKQQLAFKGAEVAIISRSQVTSDIPAHNCLKDCDAGDGGRTFDDGCRGVGGNAGCPTTSVGEENLTMADDKWYPQEDILIHEFSHAVMDVGLDGSQHREAIIEAHRAALAAKLYDPGCYMASNAQEYWAEGAQAWFDATVRTDVNSGINTREKLKRHDPTLAKLLAFAYGDGTWRYPHTAPKKFSGASLVPEEDYISRSTGFLRVENWRRVLRSGLSSSYSDSFRGTMERWFKFSFQDTRN